MGCIHALYEDVWDSGAGWVRRGVWLGGSRRCSELPDDEVFFIKGGVMSNINSWAAWCCLKSCPQGLMCFFGKSIRYPLHDVRVDFLHRSPRPQVPKQQLNTKPFKYSKLIIDERCLR